MSDSAFARVCALGKKKGLLWLVALLVLGGLLLLLSAPEGQSRTQTPSRDYEAYVTDLEARVADLVSGVSGAGEAQVMLTVDSFYSYEYAWDSTVRHTASDSHTEEERTQTLVLSAESTGARTPVLLRVREPAVRGVVVVCSGGGEPAVQRKVISLIGALFDLGADRICVTN